MSIMPAQCTLPSLPGSGPVSGMGLGQLAGLTFSPAQGPGVAGALFGGSVIQSGF